jgi:hypothetical protein
MMNGKQMTLRQAIAERERAQYPAGRFEGRGIVTCAGGPRYFTCVWVLVFLLRQIYRINLPIQVWYLGRLEMSEAMRLLLEEQGVEVVDAETVIARFPARVAGGWPLKPYAIAHSRFREVLYLDADVVPLVDPLTVFDWTGYGERGLLLWPDAIELKASNPIWHAVGLKPRDCISIDAGLLAVDKQRSWCSLDLAVLLNEHVEEVYRAIHGDKDTFLLAALLAGQEPAIIMHPPLPCGFSDLVQRDPTGDPFVHHRTGSKWNLVGPNRALARMDVMANCEQALAELRRRWNGVVFHPPDRSQRARAEEARLIAARHHHYETWIAPARTIELLPSGCVGEGRGEFEQHWAVIERDGRLVVQFFSMTSLTVELTRSQEGSWHGSSINGAAFAAFMVEAIRRRSWPHHGSRRIGRSAADWLRTLLDSAQFAGGFDQATAAELRATLSLLNERFDDVPEQLEQCLTHAPQVWRRALCNLGATLAARRDQRLQSTQRLAYPQALDMRGYDRVP